MTFTYENKLCFSSDDEIFLVMGQWRHENTVLNLLYNTRPNALKSLHDFAFKQQSGAFYWCSNVTPNMLYSKSPQGVIVGTSWEATLFKFFQWVVNYHKLVLPHDALLAWVQAAQNNPLYTEVIPNPLPILLRDWTFKTDLAGKPNWEQVPSYSRGVRPNYAVVTPLGELSSNSDYVGLGVQAPIQKAAFEDLLVKPTQNQLPALRALNLTRS